MVTREGFFLYKGLRIKLFLVKTWGQFSDWTQNIHKEKKMKVFELHVWHFKKIETFFIFNYFIMISFTTFLLNEWITLGWLINYGKGKLDVKLLQPIPLKVISCYIKAIRLQVWCCSKNKKHIQFPDENK